MPDRDELLAYFEYDPDTGVLFRKKSGKIVGQADLLPYPRIKYRRKTYVTHRVIWRMMTDGPMPDEIDHINGIRSDNRWCNLRAATRGENMRNFRVRADNKSGLKGVHWHKRARCWVASISVDKKMKHLGCFSSPEEAHAAYVEAAKRLHGEFANDGNGPICL